MRVGGSKAAVFFARLGCRRVEIEGLGVEVGSWRVGLEGFRVGLGSWTVGLEGFGVAGECQDFRVQKGLPCPGVFCWWCISVSPPAGGDSLSLSCQRK